MHDAYAELRAHNDEIRERRRNAGVAPHISETAIEAVDRLAQKAPLLLEFSGDKLLEAYGVAQHWLDEGIPEFFFADLVAALARAAKGPIRTFRYFDPPVRRSWSELPRQTKVVDTRR